MAPDLPCDDDSDGLREYAETVVNAIGLVRRWLRAFGSSRGAVSVGADETDEAGEGDLANPV